MSVHQDRVVFFLLICFRVVFPQSSLSVGSDLDLTETPSPAYPLRRSWDANQEGTGLEVNRTEQEAAAAAIVVSSICLNVTTPPSLLSPLRPGVDVQLLSVSQL